MNKEKQFYEENTNNLPSPPSFLDETPIELATLNFSNLVFYYLHKEEVDAIGRRKK